MQAHAEDNIQTTPSNRHREDQGGLEGEARKDVLMRLLPGEAREADKSVPASLNMSHTLDTKNLHGAIVY